MPAVPPCLLEPVWVEFHAAVSDDRLWFDPAHPLGCHRRRIGDRVVFDHIVAALVSGSGYERAESAAVRLAFTAMAEIVLRVRLVGGDHTDVTYDEPDTVEAQKVIDHVISTLAADAGVLRCRHGDRLVAVYSRGVAAVEVAPRGAVV